MQSASAGGESVKSSGLCRQPQFPLGQKSRVSLPSQFPSWKIGASGHFFPRNWGIQSQISMGLDIPVLHGAKDEKCRSGS